MTPKQLMTFEEVLEHLVQVPVEWELVDEGQPYLAIRARYCADLRYHGSPLEVLAEAFGYPSWTDVAVSAVGGRVYKSAAGLIFADPSDRALLLQACGLS